LHVARQVSLCRLFRSAPGHRMDGSSLRRLKLRRRGRNVRRVRRRTSLRSGHAGPQCRSGKALRPLPSGIGKRWNFTNLKNDRSAANSIDRQRHPYFDLSSCGVCNVAAGDWCEAFANVAVATADERKQQLSAPGCDVGARFRNQIRTFRSHSATGR
jgi:hypothetical protein